MRHFSGASQGLQAAQQRWSDLGDLVFFRYVVTACGVSVKRNCFQRGLVQEKNRPGLVTSYAKKTMLLRAKTTQNNTRVRRKSLRKPVACVYCDLPRRCRARWTETHHHHHHPHKRGTRDTRETPPTTNRNHKSMVWSRITVFSHGGGGGG